MKFAFSAILSVFALSFSLSVHADSLAIAQVDPGMQITGIQYRVNTSMGLAAALVGTYDRSCAGGDQGCYARNEFRALVTGLSFDAVTSEIFFAAASGKVVCANVTQENRRLVIVPTGLCGFHTAAVSHIVDNGFETHAVRMIDVFFDTK